MALASFGSDNPFVHAGILMGSAVAGTGLVEHGPPSRVPQQRPGDTTSHMLRGASRVGALDASSGHVLGATYEAESQVTPVPPATAKPETVAPRGPRARAKDKANSDPFAELV